VVPGVPPEVVAAVLPMLASGRISSSAVGLALGISKTAAFRHLSAMRAYGVAEQAGIGRGAGWRLARGGTTPAGSTPPLRTSLRQSTTVSWRQTTSSGRSSSRH
jgi:predicted ArsR family transcriptional regulator